MNEEEKIVCQIIEIFYPAWIANQKKKYTKLEGYALYKQILQDVFGFDLDRVVLEQERAVDTSGIERKLEIMQLKKELKDAEKKKKGKRK